MIKEQADQIIWQFQSVDSTVDADEFLGVTPFQAAGITVSKKDKNFSITGQYGEDIFPNHQFTILVKGKLKQYNKLEDIPKEFDNIISFQPDSTHDITFTYKFKKQGKEFVYSHWIHHDMAPWERVLPTLLSRENNGGWKSNRQI